VKLALEKGLEVFPVGVNPLWEIVLSPGRGAFPKVLNHPKALRPLARKVTPLRKMESARNFQMVLLLEAAQEMADSVEVI
jgi:hypothetical protein